MFKTWLAQSVERWIFKFESRITFDEFSGHSIGDFCVAGLMNIIKAMNAIMEVLCINHIITEFSKLFIEVFILDNRISRNWLGMPEFAGTFYSVKAKVHDRPDSYHFGQNS